MCFHGNQNPWAIKHPFISLYSKYHSLNFFCLPVMNSPVFPSLDDIYCMSHDQYTERHSPDALVSTLLHFHLVLSLISF